MKVSTPEGFDCTEFTKEGRMPFRRQKRSMRQLTKSIGVKQIGSADRYRVRMCLEEVKRTVLTLKDMDQQLKSMVKEIPSAPYLLSIPGIGALSAAVFLGELGDPAHFHNARQIVKYAGYDPQESDSGSWVGRKFISKKGRWLLRKYLFFMSMRVVVLTNYFQKILSTKIRDKEQGWAAAQEERDALCSGDQTDQSDLCAVKR